MSRYLLAGAQVLTMDPKLGVLGRADVLIDGEVIAAVGPDIDAADAERIDVSGSMLLPGFVDTHRHTWQAAFRAIASDWTLENYLVGLHRALNPLYEPSDTYAGTLLGAAEALDSGITTLVDYSHNLGSPEHADAAIEALLETGGRAVFAHAGGPRELADFPSRVPHTDDVRRVRERWFSSSGLVTMAMGLRGPQFSDIDVCAHDWALARELGLPILTHVGDGDWGKMEPLRRLQDRDLLGSDTMYIHCNTITDEEIGLIASSGGTASTSAGVEAQQGFGWSALARLLAQGVRPSLSLDVVTSFSGDMFSAMKVSLSLERAIDGPVRLTCEDILSFATIDGAAAIGLSERIGSITPGKQADLIVLRTDSLGIWPASNNPAAAVVYNGHPGMVETVFVAGRPVKRDGRLVGLDPDRVRGLAVASRDGIVARGFAAGRVPREVLGGSWAPTEALRPAIGG
jgi:5-methylthioadenosine/S-adenosylhomocysteine deaminase